MTDSPAVRIPLDPKEQPILDSLLQIRTHLELLKQDKSEYIKSQDILELYEKIVDQVHRLNDIRIDKRDEQNRVDTVLDDCLQLISLGFLTIGKKHEAPAVYSFVSTVNRLLDHLKEAAFFSAKDIESIDQRLHDCRDYVNRGRESYDPAMTTVLEARLDICEQRLEQCKAMLSQLTPEWAPTYEKLVSILRSLSSLNTRSKVCSCSYIAMVTANIHSSSRPPRSKTSRSSSAKSKNNGAQTFSMAKTSTNWRISTWRSCDIRASAVLALLKHPPNAT